MTYSKVKMEWKDTSFDRNNCILLDEIHLSTKPIQENQQQKKQNNRFPLCVSILIYVFHSCTRMVCVSQKHTNMYIHAHFSCCSQIDFNHMSIRIPMKSRFHRWNYGFPIEQKSMDNFHKVITSNLCVLFLIHL